MKFRSVGSESENEQSEDSLSPKWSCSCLETFPRLFAIFFWVVFPLFILVNIALLGGLILTEFESPLEYDLNDKISAARFELGLTFTSENKEKLSNSPYACFSSFDSRSSNNNNNNDTTTLLADMESHMEDCSKNTNKMLDAYIDLLEETVQLEMTHPLTFNWIRCWDTELYGDVNPSRASREKIRAASNQTNFYREKWQEDQNRLYEEYSGYDSTQIENCTGLLCYDMLAMNRSIKEATGRDSCGKNMGGTAWFFFTVMTTVGFGNQAPATNAGKYFVVFFGFFGILGFGQILVSAGALTTIITEDLAGRVGLKRIKRPIIGCLWWGTLTIAWMLLLGSTAQAWWKSRTVDLVGGADNLPTLWIDSIWFAYIAMTTIGLGDYFLQPEVIFHLDVFRFACQFLVGFVVLSGFLNKFSEFFTGWKGDVKLKKRLQKSCPFTMSKIPEDGEEVESALIENVSDSELVKMLELEIRKNGEDDPNVALIRKEEALLGQLLEKRKVERCLREGSNDKEESNSCSSDQINCRNISL